MRGLLIIGTALAVASCRPVVRERGTGRDDRPVVAVRAPRPLLLQHQAAPPLRSLPPNATFSWVASNTVFAELSTRESEARPALILQLREDAAAVLRANGWRETTPDSADYRLALVRVERTGAQTVTRPDPRNERRPPPRCEGGVTRHPTTCKDPAPPEYPPIRTVESYTTRELGYAIVRAKDGASAWWVMQLADDEAKRFVERETLALLLTGEKEPE
jgi:hypothetical protein